MAGSRADWSKLTAWLCRRTEPYVTISWMELDNLVGGVPASATNHYPQWWHGDRSNTRGWRNAGYGLDQVDLGRSVTFRRLAEWTVPTQSQHPEPPATASRAASHGGRVGLRETSSGAQSKLAHVDPRRALIVLQCSARKALGGNGETVRPAPWPAALLEARARLAGITGNDERKLMPAWRRYTGGFYAAAGDELGEAVAVGACIVIISGGYGILRVDEPVGAYNKAFSVSDWPQGLLSSLLVEEAARAQVQTVVAFAGATTGYAQLVRGTPWSQAGVSQALLVTVNVTGGGAMARVPRALGLAFRAFWLRGREPYPNELVVESLS